MHRRAWTGAVAFLLLPACAAEEPGSRACPQQSLRTVEASITLDAGLFTAAQAGGRFDLYEEVAVMAATSCTDSPAGWTSSQDPTDATNTVIPTLRVHGFFLAHPDYPIPIQQLVRLPAYVCPVVAQIRGHDATRLVDLRGAVGRCVETASGTSNILGEPIRLTADALISFDAAKVSFIADLLSDLDH